MLHKLYKWQLLLHCAADAAVIRSLDLPNECLRPSLMRRGTNAQHAEGTTVHGRVSAGSMQAHSQAAMVGKALARVMQLQKERDALVRRVQVRSGLCQWACSSRCSAVSMHCCARPGDRCRPSGLDCANVCVVLSGR